ncbi:Venom carboxylesterase-6 [Orchesella cincta]|uniref:Carboxylic ester hydrolase n=1 Tax=Orchesella cincta TaxID=48709 RepID=A0A1D2MZ53_ORCCI|nr:Venom carboxylesterase-6 [Orchesella cincta]
MLGGLVILTVVIIYIKFFYYAYSPIVQTNYGQVIGRELYSRNGRVFNGYLGIPYAKPPIDNLRFEPPQRVTKWEGILKAVDFGSQCSQLELLFGLHVGDENCLFLNIFSPKLPCIDNVTDDACHADNKPLPVMVYIHGGLFQNGGSNLYNADYFMDQDVVFVTMNYRLAAFGFLSTGDGLIRGNMALKDQSMALRFVFEEIEWFGGDPNRITLFGESSGGVGAHYQMLSPMSKGIISKAMSLSGTAFHFWTIKPDPIDQMNQTIRLAKRVGCPTENVSAMVHCLKTVDVADIVETYREMMEPLRDQQGIYKPVIEIIDDEYTFISKSPLEIIQSGNYSKVEWLTGVNSHEGLILATAVMANGTAADMAQNNWTQFSEKILLYEKNDNASHKIRDKYFKNVTDLSSFSSLQNHVEMYNDRIFYVDLHHGALLQCKISPVYLYYYSYRGEWSTSNYFLGMKGNLPRYMEASWVVLTDSNTWYHSLFNNFFGRKLHNYGAAHSDSLALLFRMPYVAEIFKKSTDYEMSLDLVKLLVSFASKQDGEELTFRNVTWTPANCSDNGTLMYLHIDNEPKMIPEPFTKRVEFWDSLGLKNIQ